MIQVTRKTEQVDIHRDGWLLTLAGKDADVSFTYDDRETMDGHAAMPSTVAKMHSKAILDAMSYWSACGYSFGEAYFSFSRLHEGTAKLPHVYKFLFHLDHTEALEVLGNPCLIFDHIEMATGVKANEVADIDLDHVESVPGVKPPCCVPGTCGVFSGYTADELAQFLSK